MVRRSVALSLLTLLAGCTAEHTSSSSSMLGDTAVVYSERPSRGAGTLREELRIGQADGPPEYMFSRISMFAVGPTGHIFIAEIEGELREYDAQGRYVRTLAGPGQGPGEIEYVVGLDVDDSGRVAALDFSNQRVSIYAADGTFERQMRRPVGRPGYGRDAIQWDEQGDLWVAIHPLRSGPDTLSTGPRPLYGRLVDDATVSDTVFLPERAWDGCARRSAGFAGGFFEDGRLPHLPFAQWTYGADGYLVFGCSARFSFDVEGPDGVMRVTRRWEAPVMSDEEHDYYMLLQERVGGFPRPRYSIPRERPAYLRVWRADDGRLWTWRGAAGQAEPLSDDQREIFSQSFPGRSAPDRLWTYWSPTDGLDVFDPDGTWIGHVETPGDWDGDPFPGLGDPLFRGDTIWATTKDEFDLRYVSRFVIEWPDEN